MTTQEKGGAGPRPVAWVKVVGRDGKRLRSFYSELFGWHTADVAPGADYGVMDAVKNGVGGGIGASQTGGAGYVTFFVEVDDLEAALGDAERLGGKKIAGPTAFPDKRPFGSWARLRDVRVLCGP